MFKTLIVIIIQGNTYNRKFAVEKDDLRAWIEASLSFSFGIIVL